MEIALPPSAQQRLDHLMKSGQYESPEQVIDHALELLEKNRTWTQDELKEAIRVGLESGPAGPLDMEDIIRQACQQWKDREELRAAIQVGLAQAERGEVLDGDEVFAELIQEAEAEIRTHPNGNE